MAKEKVEKKEVEKVGRPSKYETVILPNWEKIKMWLFHGETNAGVAEKLGINKDSLYEYQKKYPEFSDLLKTSKENIDFQVENALLKNALGYTYEEEIMTKEGIVKIEKVAKPETTAQIFWLKNRQKANWKDKWDIENHISVETIKEVLQQLTPEQLDEVLKDV